MVERTRLPSSHSTRRLDPQNRRQRIPPFRILRQHLAVLISSSTKQTMPRPVDTPPSHSPAAPPDGGGSLCERMQQLRQRMRSRCLEAHRSAAAASDDASLPCLLQAWRKRIEAMDDKSERHRGHRGHRRPCYTASASSCTDESDASSSASASPPACAGFPFRGPRLLHPRLERQQAACSLSGLWSGLTAASPPPSPEIYAKPRHRRHPYARCGGREAADHGKSATE
ncbi:hypothetical protein PHYPSEUDO_010269 [Phytophthora pseudosyringae]|uniref:Uncharacterized protein n=1 Tax=Phytophthora pseudosyringae TaxID=221518 RepID=A0A8T1VAK1_9STRA|nr:hypothetical protein PHYPSEUDO_010269 [Phytophthora pseudosyringae]